MSEQSQGLSDAAVKALLRQEMATKRQVRFITLRLQSIGRDKHIWSIGQEVKSLEKQLTRELTKLNEINAIFVKHGHRLED